MRDGGLSASEVQLRYDVKVYGIMIVFEHVGRKIHEL